MPETVRVRHWPARSVPGSKTLDRIGTSPWFPISVAIFVATSSLGAWQALIADGYAAFALVPAIVLGGGLVMAPIFGLMIYQAQRTHKQAAALSRSEARKTAIFDSALDCILTIDHEGRITEFNPAAERTFGYRRNEVVGRQLADVVIPPSLREQHRQGFGALSLIVPANCGSEPKWRKAPACV